MSGRQGLLIGIACLAAFYVGGGITTLMVPRQLGFLGLLSGFAFAYAAGTYMSTYFEGLNVAERRHKSDAAARVAEAHRQQDALRDRVSVARRICSEAQTEAQGAALSLSTVLAAGELDLDRADEELAEGLYSPFWEAMEDATAKLHSFDKLLHLITARKALHLQQCETLGKLAVPFSLGVAILPDPSPTHDRLRVLFRRAQKDRYYANNYEQRRIASKVDQTNAILVAGFSSLGDAVQRLGDRVSDSIRDLQATVEIGLGSLQSSLENAAEAAVEQREAMLTELRSSRGAEESVLHQLRQDADRRSVHEREARKMLDNIQRRRKPFSGEKY